MASFRRIFILRSSTASSMIRLPAMVAWCQVEVVDDSHGVLFSIFLWMWIKSSIWQLLSWMVATELTNSLAGSKCLQVQDDRLLKSPYVILSSAGLSLLVNRYKAMRNLLVLSRKKQKNLQKQKNQQTQKNQLKKKKILGRKICLFFIEKST